MMDKTAKKLFNAADAGVWAKEFCKMYPSMDEYVMFTRFANAFELGKSVQQSYIVKNRATEEFERQKKLYKDVGLMD